jgi:hypothetical protein
MEAGIDAGNRTTIYIVTSKQLGFYSYFAGGIRANIVTDGLFRDVSAWYHFVGQFDSASGTFKFFINGVEQDQTVTTPVTAGTHYINAEATDFKLCRNENSGASWYDGYLAETIFIDGQALTASNFGEFQNGIWVPIKYAGSKTVAVDETSSFTTWTNNDGIFPWTTFVSSGTQITSAITALAPNMATLEPFSVIAGEVYKMRYNLAGSAPGGILMGFNEGLGGGAWRSTYLFPAFGTDMTVYFTINVTDATAYLTFQSQLAITVTNFELLSLELVDVGDYGNNGFHLDYSNSSHFGEDQSGNNNDFTDSGLATNDQVEDSPTNNGCVLNAVNPPVAGITRTLSDGNLKLATTAGAVRSYTYGTHIIKSGKWYIEGTLSYVQSEAALVLLGFANPDTKGGFVGMAYSWIADAGNAYIAPPNSPSPNLGYPRQGDVWGIAIDCDNELIYVHRNNTWDSDTGDPDAAGSGASFTIPASGLIAVVSGYGNSGSGDNTWSMNFGQLGYTYTPPAGFLAINSANLPDPEILEGNKGMDVLTYTGTGATPQTVQGLEFSPDLVCIKGRSDIGRPAIFDTVRGDPDDAIYTDDTDAETGTSAFGYLNSFLSDGFTVRPGIIAADTVNEEFQTYVAWNWKEDPVYGFDIVSYEGTGIAHTEAHSLGVVPEMMIVKNRADVASWAVYHKGSNADPEDYFLLFNTTAPAAADGGALWNATLPTSSVFSVGTDIGVNVLNDTYIAYLFASVEGYSKVFSYIGNASDDGPFVYCGFRPRYVLLKSADSVTSWIVHDTERNTYNMVENYLLPNTNEAEGVAGGIDVLANGFKLKTTNASWNPVSNVIGIAFAEHPFKYANAR